MLLIFSVQLVDSKVKFVYNNLEWDWFYGKTNDRKN